MPSSRHAFQPVLRRRESSEAGGAWFAIDKKGRKPARNTSAALAVWGVPARQLCSFSQSVERV